MSRALAIGPLRLVARDPGILWSGGADVAVFRAAQLGFADASEADRMPWINGFRHLLDALDSRLQVVIDVKPGTADTAEAVHPTPSDFDEMRGVDLWFADQLALQRTANRRSATFVVAEAHASRLESSLHDIGLQVWRQAAREAPLYGQELANSVLTHNGWTRSWYVDRLPGMELEAGWLFKLLPPGLELRLSWHATPLPTAWIVDYLQRQLVGMRATRMQHDSAAADPALAGALPAAEDLQRRLTASQEKAFHVSTYLTLKAATAEALEMGTKRILSAARAALCVVQPCTLRMLDGHLATEPIGVDRLERKRVLDTSSLVTFLPWLDADLQQNRGVVLGRNRATGCPVMVDPFDQGRYPNANIAVFGHSGAGKTYLLSSLAMGALGLGVQVYLIDPEHEYGKLAVELGGVDIQLALGSGHALNVLDLRPAGRRDESWLGPAAADAVDLCATVCGGLDEPERALVEAAVRAAYRDEDQPLLRDVARRLPESSRVAAVL
ncbi:MAG TPA: DUF87 domain-containing protein, partial [Solirubrobacteraceae bacterium]